LDFVAVQRFVLNCKHSGRDNLKEGWESQLKIAYWLFFWITEIPVFPRRRAASAPNLGT
jgi:hypothetical protein